MLFKRNFNILWNTVRHSSYSYHASNWSQCRHAESLCQSALDPSIHKLHKSTSRFCSLMVISHRGSRTFLRIIRDPTFPKSLKLATMPARVFYSTSHFHYSPMRADILFLMRIHHHFAVKFVLQTDYTK